MPITKALPKEPMYQVFCEIRDPRTKKEEKIALTPVAGKEFCSKVLDSFRVAMAMGKQPDASNPHMVRVFGTSNSFQI